MDGNASLACLAFGSPHQRDASVGPDVLLFLEVSSATMHESEGQRSETALPSLPLVCTPLKTGNP